MKRILIFHIKQNCAFQKEGCNWSQKRASKGVWGVQRQKRAQSAPKERIW